jgi:pimeloyl-ACP methyl ester carboxylesterase
LVSGLGSKLSWIFQVPFFKEKMMTITLHNRGTGKSSRPNYPYTMDMFLDDIKDLLDYLNIRQQIHLAGISMGGMIAQNYALKYPEMIKSLILCATTPKHDPKPLIDQIKLNTDLEKRFKGRLPLLYTRAFRKRLKEDKKLFNIIRNNTMEFPTEIQDFINQAASISGHDTTNLLNKINIPTLIMVGTKDKLLPLSPHTELLHQKIPNSRLETFEGLGHGFITEVSDEVNKLMWNFIKEHMD